MTAFRNRPGYHEYFQLARYNLIPNHTYHNPLGYCRQKPPYGHLYETNHSLNQFSTLSYFGAFSSTGFNDFFPCFFLSWSISLSNCSDMNLAWTATSGLTYLWLLAAALIQTGLKDRSKNFFDKPNWRKTTGIVLAISREVRDFIIQT